MKRKQRIVLLGMVAVALILAACDGDSGNNSSESEGDSSSSAGIYSSGGQGNSSSTAKSSSSSVKGSSSSAVVSSSSAKVESSSSSIEYGSFIYGGQTYKTVTIGTQTWMAENLSYADSTAMPNLKGNSWCYDNSADSCAKYGRLYTWTAAMNIASSYRSEWASAVISTPQQGVCPVGWHIPTDAEWTTLENAVGGEDVAGTALKSTSGWNEGGNGGTDAYGFSALLAGGRHKFGEFYGAGNNAYFWLATEHDTGYAYCRYLIYNYEYMGSDYDFKAYAFSVRCLKD